MLPSRKNLIALHAIDATRFFSHSILTMSTAEGDLVYVIRASLIDDTKMMRSVSVAQLVEFLLYVKEIHALVADARSARTGRLCTVVFANDISGISQIPDRKFSQALTQSSEQYEKLYPSLAGATMIMNLPFVLQAFVGLFTPLFPQSVPVWSSCRVDLATHRLISVQVAAGPPQVRARSLPRKAQRPHAARRRRESKGLPRRAQAATQEVGPMLCV